MIYRDRAHAGQALAKELTEYRGGEGIILALPRGGVPVAAEIARALQLPLDVIAPRKLGAPGDPELAIGAVGPGGVRFLDERLIERLGVSRGYIEAETKRQLQEMERRLKRYRGDRQLADIAGKIVILVDDGIATGATMIAAARGVRAWRPRMVIIAVPVGPAETISRLQGEAERVICPASPEPFYAVGQFYQDFRQVSDEEVIDLLSEDTSI